MKQLVLSSVIVCLCSCLRCQTCTSLISCAALYCRLWHFWFYNTFLHHLINGIVFENNSFGIKYVFIFSTTFTLNIDHINTLWTGDADLRLLHYNCARRMRQIFVFNTRLVSTHYTLNYAIHGAFLRMVLLTDVYRNVISLRVFPENFSSQKWLANLL